MRIGEVEQVGTARDIYNFPQSSFVAEFVGRIYLLDAKLLSKSRGAAELKILNNIKIRVNIASEVESKFMSLCVGIRPEKLAIGNSVHEDMYDNRIPGTVIRSTFSGNLLDVFVDVGGSKPFLVEQRPDRVPLDAGTQVEVCWNAPDALNLSAE